MVKNGEIPNNWAWAKLGDVCETTSGGTPSRKKEKFYSGNICWVKSGELKHNIIIDTEEKITEEAIEKSSAKIFPKGTLLIALYGATIGRLAVLGVAAATNQAVCGIFENNNLNSKFLYYYLLYKRGVLVENGTGGAQPNISQTILKNLKISIAPFPEQHRIVAKIEELFSSLDKGIEDLEAARQQLKVYRQAVLKWAFEGRLTNETVADGVLPEGWKCETTASIASTEKYSIGIGPFGSNLKVSDYTHSGVPLIFVKNITRKNFQLVPRFISKEKFNELRAHSVKPLDILITKMGDPPGDCAIYPATAPEAIITSDCMKFRVNENITDRKFVFYSLLSVNVQKQIESITKGVAQKKMSAQRFRSIVLPIPPLPEQQTIVSEIESRLSVCDKIEESTEQSLKQAESLRQSILKKAFEGKLVPQDPNDEPASVLLDRIRAERETGRADNPQPKRKRVKSHDQR